MNHGNCPNCGAGMVQLLFSVVCREACERREKAPNRSPGENVILSYPSLGAPEGWKKARWINRRDGTPERSWMSLRFIASCVLRRNKKFINQLTLDDLPFGRDSKDGDAVNIALGYAPKGYDIEYSFEEPVTDF